jgi:hypothetical protein
MSKPKVQMKSKVQMTNFKEKGLTLSYSGITQKIYPQIYPLPAVGEDGGEGDSSVFRRCVRFGILG